MSRRTLTCSGAFLTGLLVTAASTTSAQLAGHAADPDRAIPWPMAPVEWAGDGVTELTREQIREVEASVRLLGAPAAAREAGFRPALGLIPTMGEHWVHRRKMAAPVELRDPAHLMFSPINGTEQLVGAAYAFQAAPGTTAPDAFDGSADRWHGHPELGRGSETLTMLHVWFVPSLDGPFAGHNPFLPFWAVGLEPRDIARLDDEADVQRIRALAVALAESYGSSILGGNLSQLLGASLAAQAEQGRERIRAAIPRLHQAQIQGDRDAWNATGDEVISIWSSIHEARLAAIPLPRIRQQVDAFFQEMLSGGHGHPDGHGEAGHAH